MVGIIPARAGFTILVPAPGRGHTDHPRSRGVYRGASSDSGPSIGSSPLARGLLEAQVRMIAPRRIIPARAGFTAREHDERISQWDHPRSRGVYANIDVEALAAAGSSPLARGLPTILITPLWERRDHPRSRGVYGGEIPSSA